MPNNTKRIIPNDAVSTIAGGLTTCGWVEVEQPLRIDVVIPCYRVLIPMLDRILGLKSSSTCSVMFIIIIDDPSSPSIDLLTSKYALRPDVRIRVNSSNMGASYSRNRGLRESSAEWVHFLDDDVVPDDNLLYNDERIIRSHPKAAGFVGRTVFPIADNVFTTALHLSAMTYFWGIATMMEKDIPWGVTANLITKRSQDGIEFDLGFPKVGGGEDIDFCIKQRNFVIEAGGEGFVAAPDVIATHPWWGNGTHSYWRFYNWAMGDGALIKLHPQHAYRDFAPNCTELSVACGATIAFSCITFNLHLLILSTTYLVAVLLANVLHDSYRHIWRYSSWTSTNTNVGGLRWLAAVIESSFIRMFNELGRTIGIIKRREWASIEKRFDWFASRNGVDPSFKLNWQMASTTQPAMYFTLQEMLRSPNPHGALKKEFIFLIKKRDGPFYAKPPSPMTFYHMLRFPEFVEKSYEKGIRIHETIDNEWICMPLEEKKVYEDCIRKLSEVIVYEKSKRMYEDVVWELYENFRKQSKYVEGE